MKNKAIKNYFLVFEEDKIFNPNSIEVHATNHCNLNCQYCSHNSPLFNQYESSPHDIYNCLSKLANHYRAEFCNILGGEPLLHRSIDDLIIAIRDSNISNKISILTNGSLIYRLTDHLIEMVDKIEFSIYPETLSMLPKIITKIPQFLDLETNILICYYHSFRISHKVAPRNNHRITLDIYKNCKLINDWFCHNVYGGYFFKCPQSCFSNLNKFSTPNQKWSINGIRINDNPEIFNELADYLKDINPLPYCSYCLGSVGLLREHSQTTRLSWKKISLSEYDQIDYKYLEKLKGDITIDDGCSTVLFDSREHDPSSLLNFPFTPLIDILHEQKKIFG